MESISILKTEVEISYFYDAALQGMNKKSDDKER
jgi:hypothetical protein